MRYIVILLLLAVSTVLLSGCLETKEHEGTTLSHAYIGSLTLTYSRDFPSFTAKVTVPVEITKEGEITLGSVEPAQYEGDDEKTLDGDKIRQREAGTISVTPRSGVTIIRGTDESVSIDISTTITGEQETFAWDEEHMTWISVAKVPFSLDDPVDPPMEFQINETFEGDTVGATVPQAFGTMTFEWKMVLTPAFK